MVTVETISTSSARYSVKNSRPARTAVLAEEFAQSWKSVDGYNLHGSMTTDRELESSEDLFINHYSLFIERSADAHRSTRMLVNSSGRVGIGVRNSP